MVTDAPFVNLGRGTALAIAAALAACAAAEGDETAELRTELSHRAGVELPATDADAEAGVTNLLRQPLTDDGAVKVMLLHNHRVRSSYERLSIARADLVQAGLLRNPVFDGDARFLFDGGTELELGLAQPFVDLFWRPLRKRLAEHEFAAARLLVTDALVHLVFDVRRALVDLRTAMRIAALQRDALQTVEAAHQLSVELHAAGNLTDQALAIERAAETRARLDLAAAELGEVHARETVNALLGLWGDDTQWTIDAAADDAPLPAIDLERIESRAIAASLELAAMRAGIDAAATAAGLESWRSFLPSGSAGVSAVREPGGEWGLGPHLGAEIPLFDTGAAARARAGATLRSRLHDHVQTAVDIRAAARSLRERTARLTESERFFREIHLPARAAVVRTTLQQYNAMQIGVYDVLRARRQELAERVEHAIARRDLLRARLDLQQLLAGALPTKQAGPAEFARPAAVPDQSPEQPH